MANDRFDKVLAAWLAAHREINAAYPQTDPPPWPAIQAQAPGMAARIEDAEAKAEAASVAWVNGGPGGVQTKIDVWRDLWLEGLKMVEHARN
ncbi:MAG: hypothetical protein ACLQIJ_20090 [Polyangia bacterium]